MLLILLAVAVSLGILARLGVFRASTIVGPERLGPGESAWQLLYIVVATVFCSLSVGGLFGHFGRLSESIKLLAGSAVLDGVGFVFLLMLNVLTRPHAMARLGLTIENWVRAIPLAPAALGLLLPLVYLTSALISQLLEHLHKTVPVHPLLKLVQDSRDPRLIALLILSASVVAPLAEELLFRGHVQTILVRLFLRLQPLPGIIPPMAIAVEPVDPSQLNYEPAALSLDVEHLPRTIRARWFAVIVTAILFALVHQQLAFMPSLFLLAVGLGYVYERTGNLWACIGIHSLFNTIQVILFLAIRQ